MADRWPLSADRGAAWLIEDGIGETRAALVRDGEILEAAIELPDALRAGAVRAGRLATIIAAGRVGLVALDDGGEALILLPKGTVARLRAEARGDAPAYR